MEKELTMGSLFAGIGGFELAGQWAGIQPAWSNEFNNWCCKVLNKNFTHDIYEEDIRAFIDRVQRDHERFKVDIITGGFPCQPFSHAGKRNGTTDNRYLWPEMLEVIKAVRPAYIIGENVAGLVSMEKGKVLDGILTGLEAEGYTPETYLIPACGVQAWHRRERVWIVAYKSTQGLPDRGGSQMGQSKQVQKSERQGSTFGEIQDVPYKEGYPSRARSNSNGFYREKKYINGETKFRDEQECELRSVGKDVSNSNHKGSQRRNGRELQERSNKQFIGQGNSPYNESIWQSEPNVGRVANGIPQRVDRLKGLGNAIVPQVAYELLKVIQKESQPLTDRLSTGSLKTS